MSVDTLMRIALCVAAFAIVSRLLAGEGTLAGVSWCLMAVATIAAIIAAGAGPIKRNGEGGADRDK